MGSELGLASKVKREVSLGCAGVGVMALEGEGVRGEDCVFVKVIIRVAVLEGPSPVEVGNRAVVGVGSKVG